MALSPSQWGLVLWGLVWGKVRGSGAPFISWVYHLQHFPLLLDIIWDRWCVRWVLISLYNILCYNERRTQRKFCRTREIMRNFEVCIQNVEIKKTLLSSVQKKLPSSEELLSWLFNSSRYSGMPSVSHTGENEPAYPGRGGDNPQNDERVPVPDGGLHNCPCHVSIRPA